jgi:hypothetical protein
LRPDPRDCPTVHSLAASDYPGHDELALPFVNYFNDYSISPGNRLLPFPTSLICGAEPFVVNFWPSKPPHDAGRKDFGVRDNLSLASAWKRLCIDWLKNIDMLPADKP